MDPPDLTEYKKRTEEKIKIIANILAAIAVGDFSENIPIPQGTDEFAQLYVGVSKLIDATREKLTKLQTLNQVLEARAQETTTSLNEAQRLTHMGSWEWNISKNQFKWSEELCDIYGLSPPEAPATYEGFLSRVHKDDVARVKEIIDKSAHLGEDFRFKYRILRPNGQIGVLLAQGRAVPDGSGKIIRIVGIGQDITKRVEWESKVQLRDRVLQALGVFARDALTQPSWQKNIQSTLKLVAGALGLGKIAIYHNTRDEAGVIYASQIVEWAAEGIPAHSSTAQFTNFSYEKEGLGQWTIDLSQGRPVMGSLEKFAQKEQAFLTAQNIQSILIAPIFSGTLWWGFLIFEDYRTARSWNVVEIEAVGTTSDILGAAIGREEVQMKLQLRTLELEKLNKLMIGRELKMVELKSAMRKLTAPVKQM